MDTIFMNSKNSRTSELYRILLNFTDKIGLKRSEILACTLQRKI